jgi:hypothetical protein
MKVNVSFTLEIPDKEVSATDLLEWIRFELGAICNLRGSNALVSTDIQSCTVKDVSIS